MTRRRHVTIHDVARRAGVSATTVSHTFTGHGVVATTTQQRVRAAATDLGYRPDALARGLRSSRLGVIALVERSLTELEAHAVLGIDYFLRFAGAAALAAFDQGYALMFVSDPSGDESPGAAFACDGFLVTEPVADDPLLKTLARHGIPYLSVGRDPRLDEPDTVVDIATDLITDRVLEHLADSGASRIATVVGTDQNAWNIDTETRYRSWVRERGLEPVVVRRPELSDVEGGREAITEALDVDPRLDGVYVLVPEHAVGVQQVLVERGLSHVPLVCGSDAEAVRAGTPPISAVDLQPEALAWQAVTRLLTRIDGVERPEPPVPDHGRIMVRGTSGPAFGSARPEGCAPGPTRH
ncbi:LacI family DNA-binding transcriptional regulator [Monashia sp. NPDC004114]